MEKTTFTNLFAPFDRAGASPRFQSLRKSARDRLQTLPLPSTRSEDWRFTNIAPIVETPFALPGLASKGSPVPFLDMSSQNALRLVFVNGKFTKELSSLANAPNGVYIGSLAEGKPDTGLLASVAGYQDNMFTALNTSFLNDGALIVVPDGRSVETPIEIIYLASAEGKFITQPRTLVVVGKVAQVTLVERFIGAGEYFTNAVTEFAVGEHAVVDHVKVQQESQQAYHVANTQIVMAAKSNFTTHYLSLGGALVRNEVRVRFDGEYAEATVNGLYLAGGKQHIDNFTVIDHAQPNCASHEVYKGILDGRAHGVFNGKILVRKDAQKTDAKQTNKVLLLSDDATINTKPQLEIFADDVKCTHGATIGQLDATQLFYLQSRGIPLETARRLLTFAFANDIVNRVKIEAIRTELEARIVR
jgi:Fe-S cluster assembly protein SufD